MDEEFLAKVKKVAFIGTFFGLAVLFFALGWHGALRVYVIVVGVLATLAILIQSGKGGGLAASLGGLGGESLLGVRSATPIAKATYVMLGLFLFILVLAARLGVPQGAAGGGLLDRQLPAQTPLTLPMQSAAPEAPFVPPLEGVPAPVAPATDTTPSGGAPQDD